MARLKIRFADLPLAPRRGTGRTRRPPLIRPLICQVRQPGRDQRRARGGREGGKGKNITPVDVARAGTKQPAPVTHLFGPNCRGITGFKDVTRSRSEEPNRFGQTEKIRRSFRLPSRADLVSRPRPRLLVL